MRFRKRKRKKGINNKTTLYISFILILNLAGISYGVWSQGLVLDATYTTGSVDTVFDNCEKPLGFKVEQSNDKIHISGEIEQREGSFETLTFEVKNNGTVPSVCTDIIKIKSDDMVNISNTIGDKVSPYETTSSTEEGIIDIDVSEPGTYSFKYELIYSNK